MTNFVNMGGLSVYIAFMMFALGACFGSFAGLIIDRLPRGDSIVYPGSRCEKCLSPLKFWQKIPIFSWLFLRGKCYLCRGRISARLPFLELILALCLLSLFIKFGLSFALIERFVFVFFLVCLAFIDLDTYTLPISLLACLIIAGIISCVVYFFYPNFYRSPDVKLSFFEVFVFSRGPAFALTDRILGSVFGFMSLTVLNLVATFFMRKSGRLTSEQWAMGFGDPVLVMGIGLFVGLSHMVLFLFLASAVGSLFGIIARFGESEGKRDSDIAYGAIPFGPFLALSAIYVYLF